jgi:hypothetical protein
MPREKRQTSGARLRKDFGQRRPSTGLAEKTSRATEKRRKMSWAGNTYDKEDSRQTRLDWHFDFSPRDDEVGKILKTQSKADPELKKEKKDEEETCFRCKAD